MWLPLDQFIRTLGQREEKSATKGVRWGALLLAKVHMKTFRYFLECVRHKGQSVHVVFDNYTESHFSPSKQGTQSLSRNNVSRYRPSSGPSGKAASDSCRQSCYWASQSGVDKMVQSPLPSPSPSLTIAITIALIDRCAKTGVTPLRGKRQMVRVM